MVQFTDNTHFREMVLRRIAGDGVDNEIPSIDNFLIVTRCIKTFCRTGKNFTGQLLQQPLTPLKRAILTTDVNIKGH